MFRPLKDIERERCSDVLFSVSHKFVALTVMPIGAFLFYSFFLFVIFSLGSAQ